MDLIIIGPPGEQLTQIECLLEAKHYEQTLLLGDKRIQREKRWKSQERLHTWACKLDSPYSWFLFFGPQNDLFVFNELTFQNWKTYILKIWTYCFPDVAEDLETLETYIPSPEKLAGAEKSLPSSVLLIHQFLTFLTTL